MSKHTVTAEYVDICYPDYLTDHRGILVGVGRAGQTRDDLIAQLADEVLDHDAAPDGLVIDDVRDAIADAFDGPKTHAAGWRFLPVDGNGNEIRDEDAEIPEEQPSLWVRVKVEPEPMQIKLHASDSDDGFVLVTCDGGDAAREDQSIDGARWECDGADFASTSLLNRPSLVDDLKAEGYDVDDSEYSPPDQADLDRWRERQLADESDARDLARSRS